MITFSIYVIDDEQTIRDGITMTLESDYRVTVIFKRRAGH